MSPTAEEVIRRLDGARQKWWFCSLLTTTALAACASAGVLMAMMLADVLAEFSQPWLLTLFVAWLLWTGILTLAVGRRLLGSRRSLEATARRVEFEFPELGSNLINLVQLAENADPARAVFCEAAVARAAEQIDGVAFDRAPSCESRRSRWLHCMQMPRDFAEAMLVLALLIAVAAACQATIPGWSSAAARLFAPWTFVPAVGTVKIGDVRPGNTDVLVGDSIDISAEIAVAPSKTLRARLFTSAEGEAESSTPLQADAAGRHYKATVSAVLKPFRYRLEIGDSQTSVYAIGVREKPAVESVEATFRYPVYFGRKNQTVRLKSLDLESPQYAVVELRLRTASPVAKGYLESGRDHFWGRVDEDGRRLTAAMPMLTGGTYCVRLFNDAGHTDRNPRQNRITVVPDRPPTVELLKPVRQAAVPPGATVPAVVQADDDYGIGSMRLEMKVNEDDAEPKVLKLWTDFADDSKTAVRQFRLKLDPKAIKPGQTIFLRAVAADRRSINDWGLDLKPQETIGSWTPVKIIAEEAASAAVLEQLDGLRGAIAKILERQVSARVAAGSLGGKSSLKDGATAGLPNSAAQTQSPHPNHLPKGEGTDSSSASRATIVADVRGRQIDIQKTTAELVASIGATDREERRTIRRVLNRLAIGDMLTAVARCDDLQKSEKADASPLVAAQDRIIDVLRKLLDVARHAEADVLTEMKKRPGENLPDDARQKLEEIRKKLDDFLKQQKKIIEAGENLAKMPVEDFTKKEEELLKGMAAVEDDWAKFMKDLHSDLSKLPEQDFANSSMAKELVEIQTELKMAEDALLKKSVDIAVPLEQLGYEMAEEMKTNLEKWLPDTPDREKWSQEESLTDKDKEAPMAELPTELEDLIGELMEKEEDLFDEMEDVSSSAADSLDKGAGWDAMDGPISDMSAKGVTGNRLPNSSEIGGRAGEGRQGKASGEFVSEEAVGKGGRKTPSRLTPDPVMKGQIKDHSKQSAGGATGGGKESGKGGEGLEGPVLRGAGRRDGERLAAKQATLRNKAESIDVRLQVGNYHHTDMQKMIEAMAQVERDVKAGRYQNALRQRHILADGLGNVKQYLGGEFEVRKDATTNLPADIQREILGGMRDPSPAGWEELNRRYFERLSGGGEKNETPSAIDKKGENGK